MKTNPSIIYMDDKRKISTDASRLYQNMFEQIATGVACVTLQGKFVEVNHRFCKILGYSAQQLLKKRLSEIIHPDDSKKEVEEFRPLLLRKKELVKTEKRCVTASGSIIWGKLTFSVVKNMDEKKDYIVFVLEDISDRKELEVKQESSHQVQEPFRR